MQNELIEAFFSAKHKVLGRTLKPFTLRHAFMLAVADNAFATGEFPSVQDLIEAVEICSRPSDFFLKDKNPNPIRTFLLSIRGSFCKAPEQEILKFIAYLEDYMASPQLWDSESGNKSKVNWIVSTVTMLMKLFHFSEEEAWNTAPGKAAWFIISSFSNDPNVKIDIIGEDEAEMIEALKAMTPEEEAARAAEFKARLSGK